MKKILILFLLLGFVSPVFAATWEQISEKTWIDIDSIKTNPYVKNVKSAWFKSLNPGNWELENNKKVWYQLDLIEFKCNENLISLRSYTSYDLKGNVISSDDWQDYRWHVVIPESVGERKYHIVCEVY